MNKRDQSILEHLKKFRVLDRDQIIQLHFRQNKDSVRSCNNVLKRLSRDGHIEVDRSSRPYHYFASPCTMRKDSMKIPHFKMIADFYIELSKYAAPKIFEVEFKTGEKGSVEPDIHMIWNNAPFFVEIQRSVYTKKVMDQKMERYKKYYYSDQWRGTSKYFPFVWILTDHTYTLDVNPLKVFQTQTVNQLIERHMKR